MRTKAEIGFTKPFALILGRKRLIVDRPAAVITFRAYDEVQPDECISPVGTERNRPRDRMALRVGGRVVAVTRHTGTEQFSGHILRHEPGEDYTVVLDWKYTRVRHDFGALLATLPVMTDEAVREFEAAYRLPLSETTFTASTPHNRLTRRLFESLRDGGEGWDEYIPG